MATLNLANKNRKTISDISPFPGIKIIKSIKINTFFLDRLSKSDVLLGGSVPNLNFVDEDEDYVQHGDDHLIPPDTADVLNGGAVGSRISFSSRFGDEFSVHERRVRILDMVSEISEMPPMVQGIQQIGGGGGGSRRTSSLDRRSQQQQLLREQGQSVQNEGERGGALICVQVPNVQKVLERFVDFLVFFLQI